MSGIKTFLPALAVVFAATTAQAMPQSPAERAQLFATCAGRLSALTEFQWMFDGPESERTQARRDQFVGLLEVTVQDAVADGMPGNLVMGWRLNAKVAQADLLRKSRFATDPRLAAHATIRAETLIRDCDRWILNI